MVRLSPPILTRPGIGYLLILLFLCGCAANRGAGVYHTVGKGETLWRISRTYGVSLQDVAEANDIRDSREIETGRKIFIPGARKVKKVTPAGAPEQVRERHTKEKPSEKAKEPEPEEEKIVVEKDRFLWPVNGEIISPYGLRNGVRHGGIDIKAVDGTPVKAADDGRVVYLESSMKGYGNIIILKHKEDFYTVYAHNKENLVKDGESVKRGAVIARVGSSGNATTAHLHFEVRQGKKVRNPLFFLP